MTVLAALASRASLMAGRRVSTSVLTLLLTCWSFWLRVNAGLDASTVLATSAMAEAMLCIFW